MENLNEIAQRWNSLENDRDRWEYLFSHKDEISLRLDNDCTHAAFCENLIPTGTDWDDLPELNNFSNWIGNDEGIDDMFEILGVEAEGV